MVLDQWGVHVSSTLHASGLLEIAQPAFRLMSSNGSSTENVHLKADSPLPIQAESRTLSLTSAGGAGSAWAHPAKISPRHGNQSRGARHYRETSRPRG